MRPLRLAALWQVLGALLVGMAVLMSVGPSQSAEALWVLPIPYHDKVGHFLAYMGMTVYFTGLYPRERYAFIAQFLFLLGMLMEVTQGGLPHRSADFGDMLANTAGIAAGLVLALAGLEGWCHWLERRIGLAHA